MLCLFIEHEGTVTRRPVDRDEISIGRSPENDVVIDSPFASWRHARVRTTPAGVEIEDLASHNGTWVSGTRVLRTLLAVPGTFLLGRQILVTVADVETDDCVLASASVAAPAPRAAAPRGERPTEEPASDELTKDLLSRVLEGLARCGDTPAALHAVLRAVLDTHGIADGMVLRAPGGIGAEALPVVVAWAGHPPPMDDRAWADLRPRIAEGTHVVFERPDAPGFAQAVIAGDVPAAILLVGTSTPRRIETRPIQHALSAALAIGARPTPRAGGPAAPRFTLTVAGDGFVDGASALVRRLHESLRGTLSSDLPVLLTGETGTGKEIYARAIHLLSPRGGRRLGTVNASAIPDDLLESTLFGAEEGAATGVKRQPGLLREADGGTFFFDEIGDMSPTLQAKLLRVLDQHEVLPVGSRAPVKVDVRFIAATNRDLREDVASGRFRRDLYYRLCGHEHRLPSLRDHAEDIPLYVDAILRGEAARSGRAAAGVTVKAMQALIAHDWPGNVRQLEALIRRLVHEVDPGATIRHGDLPATWRAGPPRAGTMAEQVRAFQRALARRVLDEHGGNRTRAAKALGISRNTLKSLVEGADSPEP